MGDSARREQMINAYPGSCRFCQKRVAARAGFTERRRDIWLVWHARCAPETDRPKKDGEQWWWKD